MNMTPAPKSAYTNNARASFAIGVALAAPVVLVVVGAAVIEPQLCAVGMVMAAVGLLLWLARNG